MNLKKALEAASLAPSIIRSVIVTKESDGIADHLEKIAIKSHSDHSDTGIGKMLILIDTYFVILLHYKFRQRNKKMPVSSSVRQITQSTT